MSNITVYTKPNCFQCKATFRALDKAGIDYTVVDVTDDAQALEHIKSLGYLQVPVVVAGDTHWSGFRDDAIAGLAEQAA